MKEIERKKEQLKNLRAAWDGCTACGLHKVRSQIVFGGGYLGLPGKAPVMLIGQAPGQTEDYSGKPFVGVAGSLLMETLMHLFLSQSPDLKQFLPDKRGDEMKYMELRQAMDELLYFTNVVLCWPPEDRQPASTEIRACRPRLEAEILAVDPVLIIALGKVAIKALTKFTGSIENARGLGDITIPGVVTNVVYPVYSTYHPSFISRMGDYQRPKGYFENWYRDLSKAFGYVDYIYNRLFEDPIPDRS